MAGTDYRDLEAWKEAMALTTEVYRQTEHFPNHQRFSLIQQIQRSAVSIPSNIAEGQGRPTKAQFHYHAGVARGSLCELETQLQVATNLGYLTPAEMGQLWVRLNSVGPLLNGLLRYLAPAA